MGNGFELNNNGHTIEIDKLQTDIKWLRVTVSKIRATMENMGKNMVAINQRDAQRETDITDVNRKLDNITSQLRAKRKKKS